MTKECFKYLIKQPRGVFLKLRKYFYGFLIKHQAINDLSRAGATGTASAAMAIPLFQQDFFLAMYAINSCSCIFSI